MFYFKQITCRLYRIVIKSTDKMLITKLTRSFFGCYLSVSIFFRQDKSQKNFCSSLNQVI